MKGVATPRGATAVTASTRASATEKRATGYQARTPRCAIRETLRSCPVSRPTPNGGCPYQFPVRPPSRMARTLRNETAQGGVVMLWTIVVVLLILCLLCVVALPSICPLIHILLVLALIVLILQLLSGRRTI